MLSVKCLFTLQGSYHKRLNSPEEGGPRRRHIHELRPGDGEDQLFNMQNIGKA